MIDDARHVALWCASLAATVAWQRGVGGGRVADTACAALAHCAALPVILATVRRPRLLPLLGCSVMGMCIGLTLVDVAFDVQLLGHGSGDPAPQRQAWAYYHTLLNAPHINGALLFFLLLMSFGAWIGAEDALSGAGDADARRTWRILGGLACTNILLYVLLVIPRYMRIRAAAAFEPAAFARWGEVLVARVVLLASMLAASALCMRLALAPSSPPATGGAPLAPRPAVAVRVSARSRSRSRQARPRPAPDGKSINTVLS